MKAQHLFKDLVTNHRHGFDSASSLVLAQAIFELSDALRGVNMQVSPNIVGPAEYYRNPHGPRPLYHQDPIYSSDIGAPNNDSSK